MPPQEFFSYKLVLWSEQVNFQLEDDEVRFVLDQHAELDFYSASSLKQQSSDRHVAPLGHIILIPNQLVFALELLNATCFPDAMLRLCILASRRLTICDEEYGFTKNMLGCDEAN